jgi:protein SPT2
MPVVTPLPRLLDVKANALEIGDLLAQISGDLPPSQSFPSPAPKRKADEDLRPATDKLIKRENSVANSSRPIAPLKKPANTAMPSPKPTSGRTLGKSTTARTNVTAMPNNTVTAVTSPTEAAKAPKKGSFAEIMARGKAAQTTFGSVGKIQHKPIEKGLSKKERQELKGQKSQSQLRRGLNGKPGSSASTASRDEKNGKPSTKSSVQAVHEKKVKKSALATTGYTGTARSNPTSMKSSDLMGNRSDGPSRSAPSRHRAYASEEEEDDEEDEIEEDYYSDASSDMEAAVFEVDEEEERAARIARKEDEEALREEARLRREKAEKRRMLAAMARRKR